MKFKLIFYITALFAAIKNNDINIVKLLLSDDKIDVNVLRSYFQLFRKPFNIERTHRIFNSILAFLEKVMVKMNNISRKRS